MERLKASKLMARKWASILIVALMLGSRSSQAGHVYAVIGTNASRVYLRAGEIALDYRYYMEAVDSDHKNRYYDVNVEVADQQGGKLFGSTDITPLGAGLGTVFHSKFYNPIDQWVIIRGWGGEANARGWLFNVSADGYALGGDTPLSPQPPPSQPSPPPITTVIPARNQIHAVIISGLSDPSQIIKGNVNLTGGVIALGPPNQNALGSTGRWDPNLKIAPDPELLNGDKIPPITPNVIDVRIMHHEIEATIQREGIDSGSN